jgi:hypothetical protein
VALDSKVVKLRVVVDQASKAVTAAAAAKIPVFADSDTAQLSVDGFDRLVQVAFSWAKRLT